MSKEHIIWDGDVNYDDWSKADYEEWLEMNHLTDDDISFEEWCDRENQNYFDDERMNLDKECGDILVIADLGLWNGRCSAYKIVRRHNLNSILDDANEFSKVYCDRYNVRAVVPHHDGTNYYLYREIKEGVNIQPLLDKLYNDEEYSQEMVTRLTRSLRPMVKEVYGF